MPEKRNVSLDDSVPTSLGKVMVLPGIGKVDDIFI